MPAKFHVDTYLAYDDPEHETDYSWWCGELDFGYAGGDGYGNSWDQRLELPPIELGISATEVTSWGAIKAMYREGSAGNRPKRPPERSVTPVLSFRYRYDCEAEHDYVWVEVESLGTWVSLNEGWSGRSGGWQNTGPGGFSLAGYGDPVRVRFRFVSDAGWSDEDGLYISDGGAFHVDDIRVHDAVTGEIFYWEDCEDGVGKSQPAAMPPAGDYWHLADGDCQVYSGTHAWSPCWPDSAHVPPNVRNWLMTPVIDISDWWSAVACTLYYMFQFFVPGSYGDSWQEWSTADGGATWTMVGSWYGDQCSYGYGPCSYFLFTFPITWAGGPQGNQVAGKWVMVTDALGESCDAGPCPWYCRTGITIDDTWIEVTSYP